MSTELAVITPDTAPAVFVAGGLQKFIDQVRDEVQSEVPDLTTKKGRDRIASLAAKVSRSKTAVEKPGRDYLRELKAMPKVVEAELREFVQTMDALRDQVRAPLNEWEAAESARKQAHEQALHEMQSWSVEGATSAQIEARLQAVKAIELGERWEEYEAQAGTAKDAAITLLEAALTTTKIHEAEQAELERMRKEAAEREQKEREERIAREAAERARVEAAEAAARAKAEAEAAIMAQQEAAAAAQAAAELAEQRRIAAEKQAELDRIEAEKQAAARAEAAAQAERDRIAAEAQEAERLRAAREADHAHRKAINRAALDALKASTGLTEEHCKAVITAIINGEIPAVSINY